MNTVFIYSLHDPNTGYLRYIGWAKNLKRRLVTHLSEARRAKKFCYRTNGIRKLLAEGKIPLQFQIAEVPESEYETWEIFYIARAKKLGFDLWNSTEGGDGGPGMKGKNHSQEWKDDLSKKMSGQGNHFFGKKHSPESIEKNRASHAGIKNPNFGKKPSAEWIAKVKKTWALKRGEL